MFLRENICCLLTSILFIIILYGSVAAQESGPGDEEDTYTISLVQTAETDKEIRELDDKKILTETYTVKEGDRVWQIFRERGLLEKRELKDLLIALKRLNTSLTNIDLIHPGETLVIPLTIAPIGGLPMHPVKEPPTPVSLEELKDLDLKDYTIKKGESVVKIIKDLYDIPNQNLYNKYLKLVQRVNPDIRDLNQVYPGQKVRLPIYSAQIVRKAIESPSPTTSEQARPLQTEEVQQLSRKLNDIISQIGEEWVQTGTHFIPLKSGGQINLKADSYPIINLSSGNKVIVDLYHDIPDNMSNLITSSWDNYRIVQLGDGDGLRKALDKIIPQCDFSKVYPSNEPLVLSGSIPLRVTADWIVKRLPDPFGNVGDFIALTLLDPNSPRIPKEILDYLLGLGITMIDYPPAAETANESLGRGEILEMGNSPSALIETLFNLIGQPFSKDVEIPIYQSEKTDFNLIIKADIFLNANGRDSIIDLNGLGDEIITLLKQHGFSVLSLSLERKPAMVLSKTLTLLDIPFESKPHPFLMADRDESKNVRLMVQGIIFQNGNNQRFFATPLFLPQGIVDFITQKGYRIMQLGAP
jgi:hypothetical protein